jgi:hypothetical protein
MALPRDRHPGPFASQPRLGLAPGLDGRDRPAENGGIRRDTHERENRRPRQAHARGTVQPVIEPRPCLLVIGRRAVGGVEQKVGVDENHR